LHEEPDAAGEDDDDEEEEAAGQQQQLVQQEPHQPHQLLLLPESTLYVRVLTNGMVDDPTQSGRVSHPQVGKGKRINEAFKSAPWSDAEGLRLEITFPADDAERVAKAIRKRLQHLNTLYIDGRPGQWADRHLHQAIGELTSLRELVFPDQAITRHFPLCLRHVDTLHFVSSYGALPALSFVAPNVRVLTLAVFDDVTFAQIKGILKAFPGLKRLAFRLCLLSLPTWHGDWKARMAAEAAFNNRPDGWLDAIEIDWDDDVGDNEPHVVATTMALPRYDAATGTIVRSPWTMQEAYKRIKESPRGSDLQIEGDRLVRHA
jgi:hypothetical protein